MTDVSIKELFHEDPLIRRDYIVHKTAKIRSRLYNFKKKITGEYGGVEGFLTVRVKRAKRNKRGIPVDINGVEILNIWNDDKKYSEELAKRCVYELGWRTIEDNKHNLLTTNGRDWVHEQVITNASAGVAEQGAQEVAVTTDATGADAADDALPSEITTGGLGRKNADTVTHTDNTNASSLVTTFTASGSHTAVQMAGTFYNPTASTGQLIFENTFTSTNLVSGDAIELTWNFTIG